MKQPTYQFPLLLNARRDVIDTNGVPVLVWSLPPNQRAAHTDPRDELLRRANAYEPLVYRLTQLLGAVEANHSGFAAYSMEITNPDHPWHEDVLTTRALLGQLSAPASDQLERGLVDLIAQLELWARYIEPDECRVPLELRQRMQAALAGQPCDDGGTDRAIHAAFIMEGLRDLDYDAVLEKWDQGCIELVDQLMRYVPAIHAAQQAADAADAEYFGVFDYEVSAGFGKWCGERVLATGQLPPQNECVRFIAGCAYRFFTQDVPRTSLKELILAAVAPYLEPEGEQP